MHARVTIAYPQPDRFDEAASVVRQTFQPAAREQPGFRGFMLLADRATHQLIGITLWETEADMAASAGSGGYYPDRMKDFAGLLVAPATTTTHEVAAFET